MHERPENEPRVLYPPEGQTFLQNVEIGKTDRVSCWYSPAVERRSGPRSSEGQRGLFALADIPGHMVVAIKHRRPLSELEPEELDRNRVGYNHSDEPNAHVVAPEEISLNFVVTDRPIEPGEEITVDLLGSDGS